MKEVIMICLETFLRGSVTMTDLTVLTSRERLLATIFVELGWDTGWGGTGPNRSSWILGGLLNDRLLSCESDLVEKARGAQQGREEQHTHQQREGPWVPGFWLFLSPLGLCEILESLKLISTLLKLSDGLLL